ncbi:homoserine O-succinyltransferase [Burkholderia sp. Nafp2/4-1b]|uniref:homoserine O-succinyltransferase n=1 Tax=Burkholderia sp. Nafp2/4-1b TaxID=2116686 RepID=UPI0013CE8D87|nr:homoserine O-succinyltransferase [Burkholderia sp. Nafp2/4-1b]
MIGLLRRTPRAGSMAGCAMTGYERIVHDISIRRRRGAANQCVLKSLSGIACGLSESADKTDRRFGCGGRIRQAVARCPVPRPGRFESMSRAPAHPLTQDFDRSKFVPASRRATVHRSRTAVPRLGVAWQFFQSIAAIRAANARARADASTHRRGGTQGAVDRAQIRCGASHAARPSSL